MLRVAAQARGWPAVIARVTIAAEVAAEASSLAFNQFTMAVEQILGDRYH